MPHNRISFTEYVPIQDNKQHRWTNCDDKFGFYLQGVFKCLWIMIYIDFILIYNVM